MTKKAMTAANRKAMTAAQRQKLRRDRLKAEGFTQRMVAVHKRDVERFDAFVATLVKPDVGNQHNEQSD